MMSMNTNDDEEHRKSYEKVGRIYNLLKQQMHKIYLENLLQTEGDINYRITEDTNKVPNLLHAAIHCEDLFISLVEHGADFTYKDERGRTALLKIIENHSGNDIQWHSNNYDSTKYINTILNAHVKFNVCSNPSDKNGITHFHVACMIDNVAAVEFFLNNGVDVNHAVNAHSPIFPKYTPLHFIVKYCSFNAAKILLNYGANVHLKNSAELSPLQACIKERLEVHEPKPGIQYKNSLAEYNRILEVFVTYFVNDQPNNVEYVDNFGFCILHAACLQEDESIVVEIIEKTKNANRAVNLDSPIFPGYTPLHFATFSKFEIFNLLLNNGANIKAQNAKGETPLDLCLQNYSAKDIYCILMTKPEWRNIIMSDAKTKLVSIVFDMRHASEPFSFPNHATTDFTIFVPFDSPFWPGYTLLHLVLIFTKGLLGVEKIKDCLERGADVTAKNAKGLTPLQLANNLKKSLVIKNLLLDHQNKRNNVVDNFLERGADNMTAENEKGSTLLYLANYVKKLEVVKKLLVRHNKLENLSDSPRLIKISQADPHEILKIMRNTREPLYEIVRPSYFIDDDLFLSVDNLEYSMGDPQDPNFLDKLTKIFRYLTNGNESPKTLSQIYFSASITWKELKFVKGNPTTKHGISLFHIACLAGDVDIVEMFLKHGVDVNQTISYFADNCPGSTALHLVIQNYRQKYKISADSSFGIQAFLRIVDVLLDNGANVNAADAFGETPLFRAFRLPARSLRQIVISKLINHGANLHITNVKGNTAFDLSMKSECTWEEIEIFLKAGCSFDSYNPITQEGYMSRAFRSYFTSRAELSENQICREIINNPKIVEVNNLGRTAIHNVVSAGFNYLSYGVNRRILVQREVLDARDYQVWTEIIELLIERGCDIDKQDNEGKTALHLAVDQQNHSGICGLLKNGADVNLTDKNGKTIFSNYYLSPESHEGRTPDRHHRMRVILGMHVYKLKFCGEHVSEQHKELKIGDEFLKDRSFENDELIRFHEEMERTISMNIGKTFEFSVHEFLTGNDMDMVYMNLTRIERMEIDQFFEDIGKYKFQEIDCLLKLKYRRNIERVKLIEPALESFNVLIKNELPDLCCRRVLSFLTINDLKQIITSTT